MAGKSTASLATALKAAKPEEFRPFVQESAAGACD